MIHATEALLEELRRIAGPENVVSGGSALEALSRDFYWYSPVLRRLLDGKLADAVVRPGALDELREAVAACARAGEAVRDAEAAGIACAYHRPLLDPPRPPFITDFTWNHTTLWAIQSDPAFTYLQAGFGPDFRGQFAELARRFPGEILLHLEWTVGNAKMLRANTAAINAESVVVGGIPLVRFRSEERLAEILGCCREIGVFIANPHTFYLEEGGRHTNISDKRALKAEVDPRGLLNPGKMRTYPYNPFETPGASA